MQRNFFLKTYRLFSLADMVILVLIFFMIYGLIALANQADLSFHPVTPIDLSLSSLPYYTLLSAIRGIAAYLCSLIFTLIFGYWAAQSKLAEKIIIPSMDILQSIPILGFLPGVLLALMSLFPTTNVGVELSAIFMIFTGQVWNMVFAYYSSLKAIPTSFYEASQMMKLSWYQKLKNLELPFSALNLAWNSILSVAGGWFFLIPSESMVLGEKQIRLPGIGSYMDVAMNESNFPAMVGAIVAMVVLILVMDFALWQPLLSYAQKFRLESVPGMLPIEPLMKVWFRESRVVRGLFILSRKLFHREIQPDNTPSLTSFQKALPKVVQKLPWKGSLSPKQTKGLVWGWIGILCVALFLALVRGAYSVLLLLQKVSFDEWKLVGEGLLFSFMRVIAALLISSAWCLPVGLWIGLSPDLLRRAQPIAQLLASFPSPMLYPFAVYLILKLGISFEVGSVLLMVLGVQWYLLFNVFSGTMQISQELKDVVALIGLDPWEKWKKLFLPGIFPSLVTGWISAAGGAWNCTVVAEYISFQNSIYRSNGIGAILRDSIARGNFPLFAASLTVMVIFVVCLNRVLWAPLYHLVERRFKSTLT